MESVACGCSAAVELIARSPSTLTTVPFRTRGTRSPPRNLPVLQQCLAFGNPPEPQPAGITITENGTLQVDLTEGLTLSVRTEGVAVVGTPFSQQNIIDAYSSPSGASSTERSPSLSEGQLTLRTLSSASETVLSPERRTTNGNSMADILRSQSMDGILSKPHSEDLLMGARLGQGIQGTVNKVKRRNTTEVYALKTMFLHNVRTKTVQQELSRVLAIRHSNIVHSVQGYWDGKKRELKILMEFMNLGTVEDLIRRVGPLPEHMVSSLTEQVLTGLAHLHDHDIMHRDIKPSNLLVNTLGYFKISDFGFSTTLPPGAQYATSVVGSSKYMSPEKVQGRYKMKSDIWSIGVMIAECVLGVYPLVTQCLANDPEGNPFDPKKLNLFDLQTLLTTEQVKVDFDVLLPILAKFYPEQPVLCITPEGKILPTVKLFVEQCMQQIDDDRPSCKELLQHSLLSHSADHVQVSKWFEQNQVLPYHHHHHHTSCTTTATTTATRTTLFRPLISEAN